jgi:hypothetical protein
VPAQVVAITKDRCDVYLRGTHQAEKSFSILTGKETSSSGSGDSSTTVKLILYLRPLNQSYESAVRGYPQTETVLGGSLARTPIEAVSE